MSNEIDKKFFIEMCKTARVSPKDVKKLVWGKSIGSAQYWYGEESKIVKANNIWQARAESIHRGIQEGLLKQKSITKKRRK